MIEKLLKYTILALFVLNLPTIGLFYSGSGNWNRTELFFFHTYRSLLFSLRAWET